MATSPEQEYIYGQTVDSLLMIAHDGNSERLNVLRNQQWSVAGLTKDSDGSVVETYSYDVFGNRTILAANGTTVRSTSSYNNPYGYTSRRHDKESGLMYFRARYYDPDTSEFVSQDPLEYIDGMSLNRGYLGLSGTDPTGKEVYTLKDADGFYGSIEVKAKAENVCTDANTVVKISIAFDFSAYPVENLDDSGYLLVNGKKESAYPEGNPEGNIGKTYNQFIVHSRHCSTDDESQTEVVSVVRTDKRVQDDDPEFNTTGVAYQFRISWSYSCEKIQNAPTCCKTTRPFKYEIVAYQDDFGDLPESEVPISDFEPIEPLKVK